MQFCLKASVAVLVVTLVGAGCASPKKSVPSVSQPNGVLTERSSPDLSHSSSQSEAQGTGVGQGRTEVMGPPEPFGPPPPAPQSSPSPALGPSDMNTNHPIVNPIQKGQVVLVFGPGLARGYTYIGVLRALKELKIPVGAILGTEMGGLMAALYGMTANLNQFEWALLKLTNEDLFLPSGSGFLGKIAGRLKGPNSGEKFEKALRQIFGSKDLSQSKIPIRIALQAQATGIPMILDRGNVVQALRSTMAVPSLFSPGTWSTQTGDIQAISAGSSRPYLVSEAKSLELGPTLVVDVLSEEEDAQFQQELLKADLVIKPSVMGIDYLDFKKKTEAAFRGKNAVLENLPAIKKLIGWSD